MHSRIYFLFVFAGLLIGCEHSAPRTELSTKLKETVPAQASASTFTFCNPKRYPLSHLGSVSYTDLTQVRGQRIPIRTLETLIGGHEVDTVASYPFNTFYYAYQFAHPNYCAFILHHVADEPFLELFTYNHRTQQQQSMTVASCESGADESHADQGFIRFWPRQMSRFPNDTTVLLIDRWTAQTMSDSGGLRESPFFIDSIVTRYVIRPDGSFLQMERDSVRLMRTGDPKKYNNLHLKPAE